MKMSSDAYGLRLARTFTLSDLTPTYTQDVVSTLYQQKKKEVGDIP